MFSREMERCGRQGERKVFCQDMIEGKMVKVFLDTGCSWMMVYQNLVPEHKLIEGKGELQFAVLTETRHSTRWQKSRVKISGRDFKVEAAVADNLPVQLLLGTDVPQLFKLLGSEEPEIANIDDVLVVMTRDKAQQQLEERIQQKEKEIASGSKPHDSELEQSIEQLVLLKRCRGTVLEMAHEIPISGHEGKEKRVELLSRMAMDIVDPLPRSRSGNRHVLAMCDYAIRYPEAIPLKTIDAEHIAEKMIEIFARKRRRVFHVNMLKTFSVRTAPEVCSYAEEDVDQDDISTVFSDTPGLTRLAENRIPTVENNAVRLPPYRLPHAYRVLVRKELPTIYTLLLLYRSPIDRLDEEVDPEHRSMGKRMSRCIRKVEPVLMTEFILQTDAKDRGIEAVLSLMEDGQEHPVG
eukprot:Em0003g273a